MGRVEDVEEVMAYVVGKVSKGEHAGDAREGSEQRKRCVVLQLCEDR